MTRSVTSGIIGIRKLSESPADLIQDYVNFLQSEPPVQGSGSPAGVGFLMTRHIPAEYGPGVAVKKPEIIYTSGVMHQVGSHSLGGWGTRQLSSNGFVTSSDGTYVQLDPTTLSATGAEPMTLTLHHDVFFGSSHGPIEATGSGSVATVMLWAIPASVVR